MMLRKMQKEIRKKLRWIDFSRLNFLFLQDCEKEYQPRQILHYILQTFLLSHIFLLIKLYVILSTLQLHNNSGLKVNNLQINWLHFE